LLKRKEENKKKIQGTYDKAIEEIEKLKNSISFGP